MRFLRTIAHAITHLREHGFSVTVQYAIERANEAYHERRLGVHTSGKLRQSALGIDNPFSAPYYASDYRSIYLAFRHLTIDPGRDVFLDYGSGLGRVLTVASTYPFRRVIGVELSAQLCEVARDNLRRASQRLRCADSQVVAGDASAFEVPDDVTVIFFYNPFHGPVLERVLELVHDSLIRQPRLVRIIFKNTTHLEPLLSRFPWLSKSAEFRAYDADHKVAILRATAVPQPAAIPG